MSNLYPIQYAVPQHNPPSYEDVELTDYETAVLLSEAPQQANNPNIVYYNPVAATNPQYVADSSVIVPNHAYIPTNYSTPVVINGPVIVQSAPAVVQVPVQNVPACRRGLRYGCHSNLSPQEYRVYRSAAFLKFHLFMLLIMAIVLYFFVFGIYPCLVLTAHIVMIICGMIGAKRKSIVSLVLLIVWLIITLVISSICLSLFVRFNYYQSISVVLGLNIFFMFISICNSISLIAKIRCNRVILIA